MTRKLGYKPERIITSEKKLENIPVGMSYDFPVAKSNVGNLGALEFGLKLRRLVETAAKQAVRVAHVS